jgi:hypothetical protein
MQTLAGRAHDKPMKLNALSAGTDQQGGLIFGQGPGAGRNDRRAAGISFSHA